MGSTSEPTGQQSNQARVASSPELELGSKRARGPTPKLVAPRKQRAPPQVGHRPRAEGPTPGLVANREQRAPYPDAGRLPRAGPSPSSAHQCEVEHSSARHGEQGLTTGLFAPSSSSEPACLDLATNEPNRAQSSSSATTTSLSRGLVPRLFILHSFPLPKCEVQHC